MTDVRGLAVDRLLDIALGSFEVSGNVASGKVRFDVVLSSNGLVAVLVVIFDVVSSPSENPVDVISGGWEDMSFVETLADIVGDSSVEDSIEVIIDNLEVSCCSVVV